MVLVSLKQKGAGENFCSLGGTLLGSKINNLSWEIDFVMILVVFYLTRGRNEQIEFVEINRDMVR